MRPFDFRLAIIAILVIIASVLGYYRHLSPREDPSAGPPVSSLFSASDTPSPARLRAIVDTTAKILGAPRKFIAFRSADDSGRVVPEAAIGVPASFDDLHLITALTDSLRPSGVRVAARKSLKEKMTTIRLIDRANTCLYRLILYRKELSH